LLQAKQQITEVGHLDKIIVNDIEITINKKRIKNLYVRVKPPLGEVSISAPQRMNLKQIEQFARSKINWIIAHKKKYEKQGSMADLSYVHGDFIPFHGQLFKLIIFNSRRTTVTVNQEDIELYICESSTAEQRKKSLDEWYRRVMKQEAGELVEKWQKIIGVQASGVGIKNMKTRWGTCNVKTRKIWLSLRLIRKEPKYMEYVVVHELVHLLEKSHDQVFKGYMDQFLPQWRSIRKELNESS
jgi:predicted metal-dependent hydrolase